jgi:integrase
MIRRVTLYARLREPDNRYPRIPVKFDKSGRPIPVKGDVTGYFLRIAGKFHDAGSDLGQAVEQMRMRRERLADGVRREDVDKVAAFAAPEAGGRVRLSDAIDRYKSELKTPEKAKDTITLYTNALKGFAASCKKVFIDEIDRADILSYLDWMKKNLKVRVTGSQNRTLRNRLNYLGIFLGHSGIQLKKVGRLQRPTDPGLLFRADVPKITKKKPKKHDQPRLDLLMGNADEDERDYLEILLWSGFRDEEIEVLLFSDFNFRTSTVMVRDKPQFDFHPKDWEERENTLPTAVMQRIKGRMARMKAGEDDLVFPNKSGRRSSKLIGMLHAVAKKAGLNLKGQRAGHMFRKTAGSRVARREGLPAAMEFLGHSTIETTALYLAADTSDQKKKRQSADEMYERQSD